MDEILFHASQRLEAFQVYILSGFQNACNVFHECSEQIQNTAVDIWASPHGLTLQAGLNHGWQTLQNLGSELKKNANPELVYKKLLHFLGTNDNVGIVPGSNINEVPVKIDWLRVYEANKSAADIRKDARFFKDKKQKNEYQESENQQINDPGMF